MRHTIDVKLRFYVISVYTLFTPYIIEVYLSGYFITTHFLLTSAYEYFYSIFYINPHHQPQPNQ